MPNDVWNVILKHVIDSRLIDLCAYQISFLFLPLVNKQLNHICATNYHSTEGRNRNYPYYTLLMEYCALNGHFSCLKFGHENGFKLHRASSLREGHRILTAAAQRGHYEIIEYLISHGHPYDAHDLKSIVIGHDTTDTTCLVYIDKVLGIQLGSWDIETTIQYGYIEKFEYLWSQGIRPVWTGIPGSIILQPKLKSMVDALLAKNYRADTKSFEYYYEKGNMAIYQYTYENGYSWPDDTTVFAVRKNQIDCLRYAHEHGARWHFDTCLIACENGAYECLAYAHEHGAEWDHQACLDRATEYLAKAVMVLDEPDVGFSMGVILPVYDEAGLVKCIRYLLAHQGCKDGSDSHVVPSAAEQNKMCKDYLDQRGAEMEIHFAVMYDKVDPPSTARL